MYVHTYLHNIIRGDCLQLFNLCSVQPSVVHMKLVSSDLDVENVFPELINSFKSHENLLNSSNFKYTTPESAPTGYRLYFNLLLQYYKQKVYTIESIFPMASPNQVSISMLVRS